MDGSRQVAALTNTKQFLWAVFIIVKFPVEIHVRLVFVQYVIGTRVNLRYIFDFKEVLFVCFAFFLRVCS